MASHLILVSSFRVGLCLNEGGLSQTTEESSLDGVTLALMHGIWDEPSDYASSGAAFPDEWRSQFRDIILGEEAALLGDGAGCEMRRKLLDHVSYRSAALLSSLGEATWTKQTLNVSALIPMRIVGDGTWTSELGDGVSCLTIGEVARRLLASEGDNAPPTSHLGRLRNLRKSIGQWPSTLVVVSDGQHYTLLDGNHRAVVLVADALELENQANCKEGALDEPVGRVFVGEGPPGDPKPWKFWRKCALEAPLSPA